MRFQSDPNLKPTEIQPPTSEQRTPAVLARKPAARARLRRTLRKGGAIAQNGGMLVSFAGANEGPPTDPKVFQDQQKKEREKRWRF